MTGSKENRQVRVLHYFHLSQMKKNKKEIPIKCFRWERLI